jgi:hypothetical protein
MAIGDKLMASVIDTGDSALSQIFIDTVTPAIIFLPVSTTPAIIYSQ